MAERERLAGAREPVADVDALAVLRDARPDRHAVQRVVLPAGGEGLREAAARLRGAGQHVGDRAAARLAAEVALEDRGDPVAPRQLDRRAVGEHDDHVVVGRRERLDQRVVRRRQPEVRPVEALGLVRLGQPDEDDDGVAAAREGDGLVEQRRVGRLVVAAVAGRVRPVAERRARVVEPVRVDAGAAGALVARLGGERADHRDVGAGRERQQPAVVLEQDGGRGGRAAGERVVRVHVVARARPRGRPRCARRARAAAPPTGPARPPRAARRPPRGRAPCRCPARSRASRGPARPPGRRPGRRSRPSPTSRCRRSPTPRAGCP